MLSKVFELYMYLFVVWQVNKSAVRVLAPGLAVLEVDKLASSEGPVWVRCEAAVSGVYHLSSASIPILEHHQELAASSNSRNLVLLNLTTCIIERRE